MKTIKSYSEMILLPTYEERFEYLKCGGTVGVVTFGGKRYLNQLLYHLPEWKRFRRDIILRDNGFDLGCEEFPIDGNIYVHHINSITADDVLNRRACVFDMENAISTSFQTHQAIHYENESPMKEYKERSRNDTIPWLC